VSRYISYACEKSGRGGKHIIRRMLLLYTQFNPVVQSADAVGTGLTNSVIFAADGCLEWLRFHEYLGIYSKYSVQPENILIV
jgi:hypothetical protein